MNVRFGVSYFNYSKTQKLIVPINSNNLEIQLNYLVVSCFKGAAPAYDTGGGYQKTPHCRNVCILPASVRHYINSQRIIMVIFDIRTKNPSEEPPKLRESDECSDFRKFGFKGGPKNLKF